jgi:hypothetical protein
MFIRQRQRDADTHTQRHRHGHTRARARRLAVYVRVGRWHAITAEVAGPYALSEADVARHRRALRSRPASRLPRCLGPVPIPAGTSADRAVHCLDTWILCCGQPWVVDVDCPGSSSVLDRMRDPIALIRFDVLLTQTHTINLPCNNNKK